MPGGFLSTLKELSSLECFKDTAFGENLRKAFQNGIGEGKKQLDLGPFNSLFEGVSSKFDMRTEMAIASGTFVVVDMADAAIQSAMKSGGFTAAFATNMVLRVTFVGVGRFTVALGTDSVMGITRSIQRSKRLQVTNELITLNNAKVYYKQAEM